MRDFSVKHKFAKYKTIFKLNLKPQSSQTAVTHSIYSILSNLYSLKPPPEANAGKATINPTPSVLLKTINSFFSEIPI
jgi:hypothetical protein